MTRRASLAIGLLGLLTTMVGHAEAPARVEPACDQAPLQQMPERSSDAPTGSEFARSVVSLSGPARDSAILAQVLHGNLPGFLRHLVPVTLHASGSVRTLTVCVLPDYLAVGSDRDFVFVPMGLQAALDIAERLGFELPTPRIVDAIYDEAAVRLRPQPLPAGDQMRSTLYFVRHNEMINEQREAEAAPLGALTSGHKKDLVLTNRLWQIPGRVAIYGWHRASGAPIQPLSTVHGARYADYSHGIRLVSSTVYLDGIPRKIADVLAEPRLAGLLSNEGPLPRLSTRVPALLNELQQRNPR
jgi:hypothetical protein